MSVKTYASAEFKPVQVEWRPDGITADIWLHRNITQEVIDNGVDGEPDTVYSADEVHLVAPLTEQEATERFGELWRLAEREDMTQAERLEQIESIVNALDDKLARVAYGNL